MDVLNTYGGGVDYDVAGIIYGCVVFLIFAICAVVAWRVDDRFWAVLFVLVALSGAAIIALSVINPDKIQSHSSRAE